MPSHEIHEGDALSVLRTLPDNSYHGCLTDPPYGLSFMGHAWDHGVPSADVWREVLRVLRPGAHLLAFGGTRTFHRLACAIEDAGFEIRDCMQWLYGSGFPKSHDVSKAIDRDRGATREVVGPPTRGGIGRGNAYGDITRPPATAPSTDAARQWSGHGTALKPAWEPIIVARKPLDGTVAENVQRWGCGGLAIDACRIGYADEDDKAAAAAAAQRACQDQNRHLRTRSNFAEGAGAATVGPFIEKQELGRWPANVILDEEAGTMLDAQSGVLRARGNVTPTQRRKSDGVTGWGIGDDGPVDPGDSGGASRFFQSCDFSPNEVSGSRFMYCPKASSAERDAGLDGFDAAQSLYTRGTGLKANGDGSERSERSESRNIHPTVKPIALARYLARLILPPIPNARMLTPFSGSGSEVIGALQAGWSHVDGIDSWDVAVRISRARIAHWASRIEPVQLDLAGE